MIISLQTVAKTLLTFIKKLPSLHVQNQPRFLPNWPHYLSKRPYTKTNTPLNKTFEDNNIAIDSILFI